MSALRDLIGFGSAGLYQKRKPVYPKAVDGPFRRLKWAAMAVTLAIYYVTPWLRWDRGPYAPDQAVLVDLAGRRFYMFGIEIWPHEFYYVAGLLIMAGIGLFLVTSAVGRAWCGYACPQTVWTDLFQHVERWIEGDARARLRGRRSPAGRLARRAAKYGAFLLISLATGGAWIFYFADAPTLASAFLAGEAPFVAYATVALLTATTFVLGGLMREQVCIYMCPWPRIQAAMMDEKSLTVTYRHWRGEPRARGVKRAGIPLPGGEGAGGGGSDSEAILGRRTPSPNPLPAGERAFASGSGGASLAALGLAGDCVDCDACVAVCPTGIDIREGPQIGCITCALCIDACDKVMARIGRPRGLIDYVTEEDARIEQAGGAGLPAWRRLLRPRTILYFTIWSAIGLAMLFALGQRSRLDISALQDRNPLYVQLSDGQIRNNYTIKVRNMQARPREVEVTLSGLPGARLWAEGSTREQAGDAVRMTVPADALGKLRMFVAAPNAGEPRQEILFSVRALDADGEADAARAFFERPTR